MKRLFAIFLILCSIMIPASVTAERSMDGYDFNAPLNCLWDIPLNIPIEEFVERAYKATGFMFVQNEENGQKYEVDTSVQSISLLGYPLKVAYAEARDIFFAQPEYDGKFCWLLLMFYDVEHPEKLTTDIVSAISSKFGDPTGWLVRADDTCYDLPYLSGKIDEAAIFRILTEPEDSRIVIDWRNLSFSIYTYERTNEEKIFISSISETNYVFKNQVPYPSAGSYVDLVPYIGDADAGI